MNVATLMRPYAAPGREPPLVFNKGRGVTMTDSIGRELIDAAGGLWNVSVGLGNATVIDAMLRQAGEMAYGSLFDCSHGAAQRLTERLVAATGRRMTSVYLSTTGSSAVEAALRVARLHYRVRGMPEKRGVISFDRGYHGGSLMNLSASGIVHAEMTGIEDILPEFYQIPSPPYEFESLSSLDALLTSKEHRICCLVAEPVLGSAGVVIPSQTFWQDVRRLCDRHSVLLIADEVATGAGRCGAMLASPLVGLDPDVVALAKGLTAGYFPLGATLFADRVVAPIAEAGVPLMFGSTQDGNPIGCAAALAILDMLEDGGVICGVQRRSLLLRDALLPLEEYTVLHEVRILGLMAGLELRHLDAERTLFTETEAAEVRRQCAEAGLLVYHFDGGISLFPALTSTIDEIEDVVQILSGVLACQA